MTAAIRPGPRGRHRTRVLSGRPDAGPAAQGPKGAVPAFPPAGTVPHPRGQHPYPAFDNSPQAARRLLEALKAMDAGEVTE